MVNRGSAKGARRIQPRQAHVGRIVHPQDEANVLDTGISLWFPGPKSYTGEDMAEFHLHGGTAVVSSVLEALDSLPGLRMADAGEFSRRAFDNDKMDLTTLEGVADLINAETEAQRKLAVRQAHGELFQRYEAWRQELVASMAKIEAFIDFSEEENIEDGVYEDVCRHVAHLAADMSAHLDDKRQGEIMRSGVALSIVGPPNSGKSTLLNKLDMACLVAQRQVAIVSPIAGTTRDIVETTLDIGGYPVVVRDTAGLRSGSSDAIEVEGMRRAVDAARDADIRICMLDARNVLQTDKRRSDAFLASSEWRPLLDLPHTFVVLNKADMLDVTEGAVEEWSQRQGVAGQVVLLSCLSMAGWDPLMRLVAADIRQSWDTGNAQQMPLTKTRHRHHLRRCLDRLRAFERTGDGMAVLGAEELRAAAAALGRITGRVGTEDVLDALFSQFCIGK